MALDRGEVPATLAVFVERWSLAPDGKAQRTASGELLPVRLGDAPAILKVPFASDERSGGILLRWWAGEGAARVHRLDEKTGAMVMERATGAGDLRAMSLAGDDDGAVRILSEAAKRLHGERETPRPKGLTPLRVWFDSLRKASGTAPFDLGWQVADKLFAEEREIVALHGDIHHGNVLDFGSRGWLVIDPKAIQGERTFDYVNILRNPDPEQMPDRARFHRLVDLVAAHGGVERERLLAWAYAFALLSAAWHREDGEDAAADLALASLAGAALGLRSAAPQG